MPRLPWRCLCQWLALAVLALPAPQGGVRGPLAAATRSRATAQLHLEHHRHSSGSDPGSGVSDRSWQRISAVNDTLHDILLAVSSEEEEEAINHEKLLTWCDVQVQEFTHKLSAVQGKVQMNEIVKKELEAVIAKLEHELGSISTEERATHDEVAQAEDLNAEDDAKYKQDVNLNAQSVAQLNEAIHVVSDVQNQGGFLQDGILKRLQLNEPGESSFVLGVMKRLRTGLQETGQKIAKSFAAKQDARVQLMQTKNAQLIFLQSERSDKTTQLTQVRLELNGVDRELKRDMETIPELESRLEHTKAYCSGRESSWKVRTEDRAKEKAAIHEAINYLSQTAKELGVEKSADTDEDDDTDDEPLRLAVQPGLQQSGRQPWLLQVDSTKSAAIEGALRNVGALKSLAAAGSGAKEDDVREVVRNMASLLQEQQKNEDKLMKQCKADLESKTADAAKTADDLKTVSAAIEYADAQVNMSASEVAGIYKEIDDAKSQLHLAAELRKKEKEAYEVGTKDRKLTIKVLKQAEQVLQQFYGSQDNSAGASALQIHREEPDSPPKSFSGSSRKTVSGLSAVALLEKVREAIEKEQKDADREESDAAADFEKLMKDSKMDFDNSMQEVTDRMKRKGALTVALNSDKEEKAQAEEDLISTQNQINSLHEKCNELIEHYQDRKTARSFELSQLQDVLDILAGAQVAVRTGSSL